MIKALPEPALHPPEGAGSAVGKRTTIGVVVTAMLVFGFAYYSPVETVDADPAVALIASQALVDHHTLRLDQYKDRSELAYEFETDYRVRRYYDVYYPNSLGVPILSAPAVWFAYRAGFDMLDQRTEFATQNLLSALSCTLLFVLLFGICRMYLGGPQSLTIAAISMFGTSLMSTGATGLWNSNYSLIFISLALLHLVARETGSVSSLCLPYIGALLVLGFFCRPSTAIFGVAILFYLLRDDDRRLAVSAGVALLLVGLAVLLPSIVPLPWMAGHYSPARLRFTNPLPLGLYGVLFSPSRGLFVFSPFLAVVVAGSLRHLRWLWRDRSFLLCTIWILLHTLAVATNQGKWWGGHSFGPRMLIDVMPAFVVLTCLVGRQVERSDSLKVRRIGMAAYLALAAIAVVVNTGQGLFNPATRAWNISPDIDGNPELAMDWRYPQFLASAPMLEARLDDYEHRNLEDLRARLDPYVLGTQIFFDSRAAIFLHWYEPEEGWRWTRGDSSSVLLQLPEVGAGRPHILEILAGSQGRQRVGVRVNGAPVTVLDFHGFEPEWHLAAVPGELLRSHEENTVELRVSDPTSTPRDPRMLGVALRRLRLIAFPTDLPEVAYSDESFFGEGFSSAEAGWRWTNGTRARIYYPVGSITPENRYVLTIQARALGQQRVDLDINGVSIGNAAVGGNDLVLITQRFDGSLLRANQINHIEFTLPDATTPPNESRRLALALVSVRIAPAPQASSPR